MQLPGVSSAWEERAGADELGDEVVGRVGQDHVGRVVLLQRAAGPEHRDPVAELDRLGEVVGDEADGLGDLLLQLEELRPDLLVVCDYGQILSAETLQVAPLGGINLHGSLLPRYRGAAPVQWAIIQGESTTGVSVIHMNPRLDAGPCLVQREIPIGRQEDAGQLESRLALLGVDPVIEAIGKPYSPVCAPCIVI